MKSTANKQIQHMKHRAVVTTLALCPLLLGCASLMSHGFVPADSVDPQKGKCIPVFPGVAADIVGAGVALAAPFIPATVENRPPRWFIIATPFILLDTPLSLVADILFLPRDIADLRAWRESKRDKPVREFPSDGRLDEIERDILKRAEQKANKEPGAAAEPSP